MNRPMLCPWQWQNWYSLFSRSKTSSTKTRIRILILASSNSSNNITDISTGAAVTGATSSTKCPAFPGEERRSTRCQTTFRFSFYLFSSRTRVDGTTLRRFINRRFVNRQLVNSIIRRQFTNPSIGPVSFSPVVRLSITSVSTTANPGPNNRVPGSIWRNRYISKKINKKLSSLYLKTFHTCWQE